MRNHTVRIVRRQMLIGDKELDANSRGADAIDLVLDGEWSGLSVYCILFSGEDQLLCKWKGEPIVFPDAAYERGDTIPLTVVGMNENGIRITVTNDLAFSIINRDAVDFDILGGRLS